MKRKIFFLGDFVSGDGPANANSAFLSDLSREEASRSVCRRPLFRVLECVAKIPFASAICLCNATRLNFLAIRVAGLFGKKVFYLMHGCGSHEYELNAERPDRSALDALIRYERRIFSNAHKVFCVSERFTHFMRAREPVFADKFDCCFNGVDVESIRALAPARSGARPVGRIISAGGVLPQKNNLQVCEAIRLLNQKHGMALEYHILGESGEGREDTGFDAYDFVKFHGTVPRAAALRLMAASRIFVLNSRFESFSLVAVEALLCGCDALLSDRAGVLDLLSAAEESDVIADGEDAAEIAAKIKYIYDHPNGERLLGGLDDAALDARKASRRLYGKIRSCLTSG
ncbi:MAG: glycosyltransferase family 4 protein [Clostridiales Family XIII bacterium]|nr:glycosyltransferase family 4 protein [Clostridiales Family XIII bacterium]